MRCIALHCITTHYIALKRNTQLHTAQQCTRVYRCTPFPFHTIAIHCIKLQSVLYMKNNTWCINYMLHHVSMHRIIAIAPLLSSTPRVGGPRQVNRNETERRIHRRAAQAAGVPRPSRTHEPNSDVSQSITNTSKSMKLQNMRSTKTWRRSS